MLSNGVGCLNDADFEHFQALLDEDKEYQAENAADAPFKPGETVYVVGVDFLHGTSMPTHLINKPLTVIDCWRVPGLAGPSQWDVDVEGCDFCLRPENLSRTKPY